MSQYKVLVACEFSGVVRRAFRARGHNAWSCDLLPAEDDGEHIQGDVLKVLDDGWDMMIAHPPCTRLTNSGVRWLGERDLWRELDAAAAFFRCLLNATGIKRRAIENPIPHRHAVERIGRKYDQIIQPWMFGHGETKAICWWLENIPPLTATKVVEGRIPRVHHASPGPDRWKNRSRFYSGIADAAADQWTRHPE